MNTPLIFIIFGATGDLTAKKLMPALYDLVADEHLSSELYIIGVGRRKLSQDGFRDTMKQAVQDARGTLGFDAGVWTYLSERMDYQQGLFESEDTYTQIAQVLSTIDKKLDACIPRFFYLATPPQYYETILTNLDKSTLAEGCGHGTANYTRVLIEKPFGKDLATAQRLDQLLSTIFEERQIYRIDHYLGKETVQNLLSFRFGNGIFEPTWCRDFVDHVQITLAEDSGIGVRGSFYDGVGALRDVVQNHMLEMLAITAMEVPKGLVAGAIRDAKAKVLQSIVPIKPEEVKNSVVRAQYEGYGSEAEVGSGSQTETFVALKLMIDTERWRGVPFYLRTGKHMKQRTTEISLHFKKPPCPDDICFFPPDMVYRNALSIRIQPNEGIHLRLMVKQPGHGMTIVPTHMNFAYEEAFPGYKQPEAYERLLLDAIRGDQTLFTRTDEIEASWMLTTEILEGWQRFQPPLFTYAPGENGPKEAEDLIQNDGRHWYLHGL